MFTFLIDYISVIASIISWSREFSGAHAAIIRMVVKPGLQFSELNFLNF